MHCSSLKSNLLFKQVHHAEVNWNVDIVKVLYYLLHVQKNIGRKKCKKKVPVSIIIAIENKLFIESLTQLYQYIAPYKS